MEKAEQLQLLDEVEARMGREGDAAISTQEIAAAVRTLASVVRDLVETEVNLKFKLDPTVILADGFRTTVSLEESDEPPQ